MAVTTYWHLFLGYLAHFLYLFLRTLARFLRRYIEIGASSGKTRPLMLCTWCIKMPLHQSCRVVILHHTFDVGAIHAMRQQVLLILCRTIWRSTHRLDREAQVGIHLFA